MGYEYRSLRFAVPLGAHHARALVVFRPIFILLETDAPDV